MSVCEKTGKDSHTYDKAIRHLRRLKRIGPRERGRGEYEVYRCAACEGWHVGGRNRRKA